MYTLASKYLEEFTSFHRKALEDNELDQNEYKKLCGIFNNYLVDKATSSKKEQFINNNTANIGASNSKSFLA